MMNTKLLAVVTPTSIYRCCSTRKTFWEENFTGEENFTLGEFSAVNMKICGRHNVRKHIKIKGSVKYVILDISLKFDSLDKIKITSSESKDNLERSGKGLSTSLGLRAKARPNKYKEARYAIVNVSKKERSKIIRWFEILTYESYERKRPKHDPTDSYFYLARKLAKCMTKVDALKLDHYSVRMEMTATK